MVQRLQKELCKGMDHLDPLGEDSAHDPEKIQLEKLHDFLRQYTTQLRDVEEAVEETFSDSWDSEWDPLEIQFRPLSNVKLSDVFDPTKEEIDRIFLAFGYLMEEAAALRDEATQSFYAPLSMIGQPDEDTDSQKLVQGDCLIKLSRLLPFLHALWRFRCRCFFVVHNFVRQLAVACSASHIIHERFFTKVHLVPCFESLASLLMVLVTIDELIASNTCESLVEVRRPQCVAPLIEVWRDVTDLQKTVALQKRMMRAVRADPSRWKVDVEKLPRLEAMLDTLERDVLSGKMFSDCALQPFAEPLVIAGERERLPCSFRDFAGTAHSH